jgi:glycosyltransferase involved in cell wall biosynthesis
MQIHQVLVSASPGDAITNAAFEIRDLLRQAGPSEIFAHHIHPGIADDVVKLDYYGQHGSGGRPRNDVLLYHASIGDPEVHGFITERPERLVLVYHNISPSSAFATYEPGFAGLLEAGRKDLAQLRDRTTLALADSEFNAAELVALGYRDVRVSPLIIDPAALHGVELDEGTTHHLTTQVEGPVLLFVGQILPHKRPELLVQAFHVLVTYLVPEANLVLVGSPRLPRFRHAVQDQIAELNLHRAWITGAVPPETLRSFYERANLFVTASDHEGFCVPLLEAMSFGLPVVARATTAIPETLAGAGILVDADDSTIVMAEALAEVLTNVEVRDELTARGRRRLADFDPDRARQTILEHLLSVV